MEVGQLKKFKERLYNLPSPEDKDVNKWCDIIELICLISNDKQVSKGDIRNYITQDNMGSDLDEASDEVYDEEADTYHINEILKTELDFGSEDALIQDNISQFINSWFDLLAHRHATLGEYYPFKISADSSFFELNSTNFSDKEKFYLYLLLASNLRLLDKSSATKIAGDFEAFAFKAFGYLLPDSPSAKKYVFGKGLHRSSEFKYLTKYKMFEKLAEYLNTSLQSYINEQTYSDHDTGENGLDIVGWIDFPDTNPGKLILFGQCACGVEWEEKAFESSELNWETILNCSVLPSIVNSLFIPRFFRNTLGWQRQDKIKKAILFDRYRILKCTQLDESLIQYFPNSIFQALLQLRG